MDQRKRTQHRRLWFAFLALIAVSVAIRLIVILNSRARASWDTPGFILTARAIASFDFSQYDGKRTPIYPLLMLLAGMDWDNLRLIQSLLGIAIASLMFVITWKRLGSAIASFIVGLLCSIAVSELLFEQVIYSETLCTFFIVVSLYAYERAINDGRVFDYVTLGMSAALAGMTRPMFLYLGPLYLCLMLIRARPPRFRVLRDARSAWILAPTLVLALGWSIINQRTINYFGVTTTLGFNLSNHSGAFMELAPSRYKQIADIYLRYRAWQISTMGTQAMTVWYAEGELKRATGLSTAQLSQQFTRMSLEMFAEHPLLYLASVVKSWVRLWGSNFYRFIRFFKVSTSSTVYTLLIIFGSLQLAVNLAFLSIAGCSAWRWARGCISFDFELGVIVIVLAGSLVQALLEYGENVRYLAPLVPLTIYTVAAFAFRSIQPARR